MKSIVALLVAAAVVTAVVAIGFDPGRAAPKTPATGAEGASSESIQAVADANNQFALDFYAQLAGNEQKNIFFSPYSISTALGMTYEGARGQTADEIRSVFHFPENDEERRRASAALYNLLNADGSSYLLSTANALWVQKNYGLLENFTKSVEAFYNAKAENLDLFTSPEQSRQTINTWVEDMTNSKVKDLIPAGTILTRIVLTNAIYFKGTWIQQFDKSLTTEEDFRTSPGQKTTAPLMRMTDDRAVFNYGETDGAQIIELPYEGESVSMLVILPKTDDLGSVEQSLSAAQLAAWKSSLREQRVDVYLPRFSIKYHASLNQNLAELGMPSAFRPPTEPNGADFSGMTGMRDLHITAVLHGAFVEVNEEGTEAAGATAVIFTIEALDHPVFRADHPFLFLIQERSTGTILFMGRVTDPSG